MLAALNNWVNSFPHDIFDSNNGDEDEIFFNLVPFAGYAVDLFICEGEGSKIRFTKMIDSLLYFSFGWGVYKLDLFMFVYVVGAVWK